MTVSQLTLYNAPIPLPDRPQLRQERHLCSNQNQTGSKPRSGRHGSQLATDGTRNSDDFAAALPYRQGEAPAEPHFRPLRSVFILLSIPAHRYSEAPATPIFAPFPLPCALRG